MNIKIKCFIVGIPMWIDAFKTIDAHAAIKKTAIFFRHEVFEVVIVHAHGNTPILFFIFLKL
jgi:hypothetical protein